jgi:hypothetical protein
MNAWGENCVRMREEELSPHASVTASSTAFPEGARGGQDREPDWHNWSHYWHRGRQGAKRALGKRAPENGSRAKRAHIQQA